MKHLTDSQLIDRVYGIAENVDRHLAECQDCAERWQAVEQRHRELIPEVPATGEFLAAQRRGVYARVGSRPRTSLKWAPAAIAACLLAAVTLVHRPAQAPNPVSHAVHADSSDAQLFGDVYSMEQTTEPRAAAPLHELFEDNQ